MTRSSGSRLVPENLPSDLKPPPEESIQKEEMNLSLEEAHELFDTNISGMDKKLSLRQRKITYSNLWVFERVVPALFAVLIIFVFVGSLLILFAWTYHVVTPVDWQWAERKNLAEARIFALITLVLSLVSGAGIRYFDFLREKLQLW